MLPLWPLLAHPAGQPFRAGLSGPCQSQGGRWAGSLGFGLREGPWQPGQCGRRQARQRILRGVVAVLQSKDCGSLSSVLSFWVCQPVGSIEPRKEVTHWVRFGTWQRFILGVGRLGFEAYHWGPKPPWALALQNQRIKVRHSGTDRKWFSSGEWNGMVIYPS